MNYKEQKEITKQLCNYLLNEYYNGKTNCVTICITDIPKLNIDEKDLTRILTTFEEDRILSIDRRNSNDYIKNNWEVHLSTKAIEYFEEITKQ